MEGQEFWSDQCNLLELNGSCTRIVCTSCTSILYSFDKEHIWSAYCSVDIALESLYTIVWYYEGPEVDFLARVFAVDGAALDMSVKGENQYHLE